MNILQLSNIFVETIRLWCCALREAEAEVAVLLVVIKLLCFTFGW